MYFVYIYKFTEIPKGCIYINVVKKFIFDESTFKSLKLQKSTESKIKSNRNDI